MVLVGFEGLGGSGKTTLIRLVKGLSPWPSVRECRDEPPAGFDIDTWYLRATLASFDRHAAHNQRKLLDRSFIATLGVMYLKARMGEIPEQKYLDAVRQTGDRKLDGLVLCLVDQKIALNRRGARDGFIHPVWGDPAKMVHYDRFLREQASAYARHTRVIDTGSDLTDDDIVDLDRWIRAVPPRP